jgi:single-stranded-DNA-specific exonuclease
MPRISRQNWIPSRRDPVVENDLSVRLGLHPLAAAALAASGVTDPDEAAAYLSGSLADLPSPYHLRGMDDAVSIVLEAVAAQQPILVHGDFDADGICSTAVLVRALHRLGAKVHYFLPDRFRDDYGVSARAIKAAAGKGVELLLTADCGITAHKEVLLAKSLGCKVVVLDHHEPEASLPEADALVAPRRPEWCYEWADMPASALALKLVQAMAEALDDGVLVPEEFVDLAAIGVIADVAPMIGENRIIARAGLERMANTTNVGLRALMNVASLTPPLRAYDVAFRLAPRLNAAGRLADATDALDLLLTDGEEEARRLALYLDQKNRERQQIQEKVYREAARMMAQRPDFLELPVVVLSSPDWHAGVIGVVASKMVEEFGRPAILFSEQEGHSRGSGRSIEGIDMVEALRRCDDFLGAYGGHAMAAGLRIDPLNLDAFRQGFADVVSDMGLPAASTERPTAIPANLAEIDESLVADLARLEPFGPANPEPAFCLEAVEVVEVRTVGKDNQHLKLYLTDGGSTVEAIGFRMGNGGRPQTGDIIDLCFLPTVDEYWGRPQLQLRLEAWRPTKRPARP